MFDCMVDHFTGISPCSFARSEVGSFTCIGCDSPIHKTDSLKSPPKDLAMRIKRLAKGRYCHGGIWTHAEPPVWKFAVYRLALRPLGQDSSFFCWWFINTIFTAWYRLSSCRSKMDEFMKRILDACSSRYCIFNNPFHDSFIHTFYCFLYSGMHSYLHYIPLRISLSCP